MVYFIVLIAFSAIASPTGPVGAQDLGDWLSAIARKSCVECHAVEGGQVRSPPRQGADNQHYYGYARDDVRCSDDCAAHAAPQDAQHHTEINAFTIIGSRKRTA